MATNPCEIGADRHAAPNENFVLVARLVLALAAAIGASPSGRGAALAQAPNGLEVLENNTVVRRVCVRDGVPTFHAPEKTARIANGASLPGQLGGGTYVTVTGRPTNGYEQVRTLTGAIVWIPETLPATNARSLCLAQPSVMRVCWGRAAGQTVAVYQDFTALTEPPIAFLDRGGLVQLWGYFEDRGRWAFVEKNGLVGFVSSAELCHETSTPPDTEATSHFSMTVAGADPRCYQQYRTRAASEIQRIVIHNSEQTSKSANGTFQACDPTRPASAHVGIDRDGWIYRFVEDRYAAFHTGGQHGGFDASSLGIELIASKAMRSMTPEQEQSLVALIRFWSKKYGISPASAALDNSTRAKNYANVEFWSAPITIHRFTSAGRDTDCPSFVWTDSARGDDEFFEWRRSHFTADAGHP